MADLSKVLARIRATESKEHEDRILRVRRLAHARRQIKMRGIKDPAKRRKLLKRALRRPPEKYRPLSQAHIARGLRTSRTEKTPKTPPGK